MKAQAPNILHLRKTNVKDWSWNAHIIKVLQFV